jgi:hypothetical protein
MEYLGTDSIDESALTIDERLTRCYELAAYALTIGTAPDDAILVHGTWQHVVHTDKRIGHAWLELPDGQIWEPIRGVIWYRAAWNMILQPIEERRYTKSEAHNAVMFYRHWGRWHESEYK